jgi:hypothetical protein
MTVHGRAADYLDGALAPADEAAFLEHAAGCATCEADLHAEVQLRDREASLIQSARAAEVIPLAARRPRRWLLPAAGVALAAAAAAIVLLLARGRERGSGAPHLALAASRGVVVRLAYAGAARHRPYDVPRGEPTPSEHIPAGTIAALERAGDCHGAGAALVLDGQYARARRAWDGCRATTDLDADRAALAVLDGRPADALALAARALAARADHPVALWNRALALEALGRAAEAADAYDRAAAAGDDWAAEARARAAAARAPGR